MKSIVLQTAKGDHLGFVLCAIPEGQLVGDCVFSIVPRRSELFDDPDVQELFARKDLGESHIQLSPDSRRVTIRSPNMDDMYVNLDDSGVGHWGYARSDGDVQMGLALTPKK
jgi:hypothetical protein